MFSSRRLGLIFGSVVLTLSLVFVAAPVPAAAEDGVKTSAGTLNRSAGTLKRSAGSRETGSLSSDRRGRTASTRTSRKSSRPSPRTTTRDTKKKDKASDKDGRRKAAKKSGGPDSEDDSILGRAPKTDEDFEAIEAEYNSRTLGRACMYGGRGEVIYRPAGARCRGDGPGPAAKR